jgi:putative membrane protein
MGATEVVHGVSGSTMALILGAYQELIVSLRSIDRKSFNLLRQGNVRAFWGYINGGFLLAVVAGTLCGIIFISSLVGQLLQHYFIVFASFLFGIVLISGILLLRRITRWSLVPVLTFFFGIAINYSLGRMEPFLTADNYFFVLLAGFLAGFILMIPGVSSAFILLLIGKYQYIVTSFSELNPVVIPVFFIGWLGGLWLTSRFMYRMFADYYNATVALLAGLMLGALNKLWPWRNVFEYVTNGSGEQSPAYDVSVLPWKYMTLTGKDPQVFLAILMTALGVFLVVLIEKITARLKTKI